MKNIRYIVLLVSILFLSGCSVEYNLDINNNTITENVTGKVTNKELDNSGNTDYNTYLYMLNYATPLVNEEGEYNKNVIDKKNYKKFDYTYVFDDYSKSNALNTCFDGNLFIEDEEHYYINAIGNFNCQFSDKVVINISTDYIVTDTNATYKNGKYTWTINKDNNEDLDLYIDILKIENTSKNHNGFRTFRIIGLIVLFILSILAYLLYRKNNKNN